MSAQAGTWQVVPGRARVRFTHKTAWGLVKVHGIFTEVSGGGQVGPDGAVRGALTIGAASVDTKNKQRDKHLRSADFFNVASFPEVTYVVHGGEIDAEERLSVSGELTVAGVTRPLVVTAHIVELSDSSARLRAEVAIDRGEFGMTWNRLGGMGGLTSIEVEASFERTGAAT